MQCTFPTAMLHSCTDNISYLVYEFLEKGFKDWSHFQFLHKTLKKDDLEAVVGLRKGISNKNISYVAR